MKNLLKYSVLTIGVGLASACNGGGGSNDTPKSAYDKKEVNANTQSPSISYVRDEMRAEVAKAKIIELIDPITKRTLKTINLADYPKGTIKETVPSMGNANLTTYVRIINLSYSQALTLHTNKYEEIAEQGFAGGHPTSPENLPKGTIIYNGTSLGLSSSGLLSLTANFDSKTVQGNLYNRRHENGNTLDDIILEQSHISSSLQRNEIGEYKNIVSFTGSTRLPNERGSYYGMFAGPNAEEVVGFVSKSYKADPYESFAGERQ